MGYYIQVPEAKKKAKQLVKLYGGESVIRPETFSKIPEGKALICVIDNGLFEAAAFCYDQREFEVFSHPDGRPKSWILMDLEKTKELTGYKER